jgi:beta-lactamase class A
VDACSDRSDRDVLARVDGGIERLDRTISFGPREIIAYSPVLAKQPRGGSLTVADLCAAAIERSDNAAANLLLATLGGPRGVTRRSPGRLDRRGQDRHDEHRRQRRRSVVRRFRP